MLRNFINICNNVFCYLECNYSIVYSTLGIIRIKSQHLSDLFINKLTFCSIKVNITLTLLLREIFLLISLGYFSKFKIVGVGYRQFYEDNVVVYKLRYSHLIFNILDLDVLVAKKHKKKKYFTIFSLNKFKLNRILNIWLLYRVPNVYTKKGFLKKGVTINFKKMMKKII